MFVADGELTNMGSTYFEHTHTLISNGEWHKLENKGDRDLHIVEIQFGDKCEETDIERK